MRRSFVGTLGFAFISLAASARAQAPELVTIEIETRDVAAKVIPSEALGAGLDGRDKGSTARTYQSQSLRELTSAPFYRVSYRIRTELGAQVWHWNEEGTWSDAAHSQGYWVSSDKSKKPILVTNGYRLPRRGNTNDQANNDGYSRLSDGDEASFWKSNPYLDAHYTGTDNALHPQWVLINFNSRADIQAMRILWGEPYAVEYEVQYWDGEASEYYKDMFQGRWRTFPHGKISSGAGGETFLQLSDVPVSTPYLRILLKKGSGTAPAPSHDIRDRLGFAIREIYAGGLGTDQSLTDVMEHGPDSAKQTEIVTSSTDPWHRSIDRDENVEQPGLDLVMRSGLTQGRPLLAPTGLLYDTPENAAAEIRFIKARGYNIGQIELGEEPDGQFVSPEHYGALFVQFADAIHKVNPSLAVGGPGFQSEVDGWNAIPDDDGNVSWMKRFLTYLASRNRTADFGFFSFEWYPFDDLCTAAPSQQLVEHPRLVAQTLKRLEEDGVPKNIPWIITEYGYSSFAGQREVELPAALLNAEIVAQFLMAGIKTAYLYGVEPNEPILDGAACETWGNLMMLQFGSHEKVQWKLPTYYGASLVLREWFGGADGAHELHRTHIASGAEQSESIAAYAVHRPDGRWALLILNKDSERPATATVKFDSARTIEWRGPHEIVQYSPRNYSWKADGDKGHPELSRPPERSRTKAGQAVMLSLPPMSITVVKGAAPSPMASR